jgi:hypothetical protein
MNRQVRPIKRGIRLLMITKPVRMFNFFLPTPYVLTRIIFFMMSLTIILFSYFVAPEQISITGCAFYRLTGYPCLTCGLTRSFHAMAHLELINAFAFHLMGPLLFMGVLLFGLKNLAEIVTGKSLKLNLPSGFYGKSLVILLITWIFYWVLRICYQ